MAKQWQGKEWIVIQAVLCMRESQKAYLMSFADGQDRWVPKSQLKPGEPINDTGRGPITVSKWWYEQAFGPTPNNQQDSSSGPIPINLEAANKVYRKLVAKYHPDRFPGSQEIMTDINELWQAIKK